LIDCVTEWKRERRGVRRERGASDLSVTLYIARAETTITSYQNNKKKERERETRNLN
jgi:hypothetical protein